MKVQGYSRPIDRPILRKAPALDNDVNRFEWIIRLNFRQRLHWRKRLVWLSREVNAIRGHAKMQRRQKSLESWPTK